MALFDDPRKAKLAFVLTLVFAIIFFLGCVGLGYFFYTKYSAYKDLSSKYNKLKNQNQSTVEELKAQNKTLTDENTALKGQITTKDAGLAKIKAYNEFFKYENYVIKLHNGFTGWTDAEYRTARTKAQGTGDSSFVSLIDWGWNRTDIDPTTRAIAVWEAIAKGIESGL